MGRGSRKGGSSAPTDLRAEGKTPTRPIEEEMEVLLDPWAAEWDRFSEKTLNIVFNNILEVEEEKRQKKIRVLDCEETSKIWYKIFQEKEIEVRMLAGLYEEDLDDQGQISDGEGGQITPGLGADHVWLEVEGHLFDPTAGQFVNETRPFSKRNYYALYSWDEDLDDPPEEVGALIYKND